ncbi:MAG TPA: hypothetical protein VD994_12805 [Prosthecobacter sp.]|nr:hypothetical protein [Prosthecobacter sp.]
MTELEATFNRLLDEWREDTLCSSNGTAILLHPAHLAIISLGVPVLPLIFKDMASGRGCWFTALDAIFLNRSPITVADESNATELRAAWLKWARSNGYLPAEEITDPHEALDELVRIGQENGEYQ